VELTDAKIVRTAKFPTLEVRAKRASLVKDLSDEVREMAANGYIHY